MPPGRNDERILLFSIDDYASHFVSFAAQIVIINELQCV